MSKALTIEGIQKLFPALRSDFSDIARLQTLAQKDLTRMAFHSLKMGASFEDLYFKHREELKKLPKDKRVNWKNVCRTFGLSDEQVRKLRIANTFLGHLTSDELKTFLHQAGFLTSEEILAWGAKAKQIGPQAAFSVCARQPENWDKVAHMFEKFEELEFKSTGSPNSRSRRSADPFAQIRAMIDRIETPGCGFEAEKNRYIRDLNSLQRYISKYFTTQIS